MPFHYLTQVYSPDTLEMLFRVFNEAFLIALEERAPWMITRKTRCGGISG